MNSRPPADKRRRNEKIHQSLRPGEPFQSLTILRSPSICVQGAYNKGGQELTIYSDTTGLCTGARKTSCLTEGPGVRYTQGAEISGFLTT